VIRPFGDAESRNTISRFIASNRSNSGFLLILAGIARALYVPQIGIITQVNFHPSTRRSSDLGRRRRTRDAVTGAAAGALLVNYAKTYFTSTIPEACTMRLDRCLFS